jgi:hypothetical protein
MSGKINVFDVLIIFGILQDFTPKMHEIAIQGPLFS